MAILSVTTKQVNKNVGSVDVLKLLNDASADETTSDAVDVLDAESISLLIEAGTGVNAGVVKLEGAVTSDYDGTWYEIASVTTSAGAKLYQAGAAVDEVNFPYVRARIETVIGVGTIDVYLVVRR